MKAGTLFSGIGAPEVSAPWADWRWSADIDDFANAVRAHHWPEVPNLGDVAAIRDPEPVDLIVFGSPCQSFSVAGKRLGLDDPRGNLALVALALVARVRPRWFVFENVPGLLSSDDGRDFQTFLERVGECGYQCAWRVFDAQFAGVPQRRRRVFLVGYPGDWRPPAAVLFEPDSLRWNPPPRREAGEGPTAGTQACAGGGSGLGTDFDLDGGLVAETVGALNTANGKTRPGDTLQCALSGHVLAFGGNNSSGPIDTATAVTAHGGPHGRLDFASETFVAFTGKDHGADAGDVSPTLRSMGHDGSHANGGGQVAVAFNWQGGGEQTTLGYDPESGIAGALQASQHPAVAFAQNQRGELRTSPVSPQLTCGGRKPGEGFPAAMIGPMVRRLTPVECERLQGFPDNFTDIPWRGGKAPDGRRYKALGNSMAVPVIGWILDRIRQFERAEAE